MIGWGEGGQDLGGGKIFLGKYWRRGKILGGGAKYGVEKLV